MTELLSTLEPNLTLATYTAQREYNFDIEEGDPTEVVVSSHHRTIVSRQDLRSLAAALKLHSLTRASNPIDITVVDRISHELRFNLTYHLLSPTTNTRHSVSTWTRESKPLLSLQSLYPAFNWAERETWDMYGIFFVKHPDLRRILTDYGFTGFPLQKSFPLSGFKEVQFEDSIKHVEYSDTELTQSYRLLSFNNSWARG